MDEGGGLPSQWNFLAPPAESMPPRPAERPTFSVVVAAYNVADLIREAIDSALAQTHPPAQIVVCDDGSTDDLVSALAPYGDGVTLIRQPHGGVGAAKDAAAEIATGDFVVILDADDIFLPERLKALGELAMLRPDLDLLTTDAWLELDGQLIGRYSDAYIPFAVAGQRRRILERCFLFPLVAIRRDRFLEIGGFDRTLTSAVDWDLWLRLILAGAKAGFVDAPLAHYRIREGSVTSNTVRRAQGHVRVAEKALSNPDLEPADRTVLLATLRDRRRQLRLTEAEHGLREAAPDARRRVLAIALGRNVALTTRLKCAASAFAPSYAARFLIQREHRVGRSRLGRPVPRG